MKGYRNGHRIHAVQTMVEVVNMLPPPHMLPQKAPKLAAPLRCAITGKPAKYRDPASGYGYADLEAYKELKQRMQSERRGLTGKRTKRPSSKGLGMLPCIHQQHTETDPATAAAHHHTPVPSDIQAADATDQVPKQAQLAADAEAADSSHTAIASDTSHAAAATPVTALSSQSPAAAVPAAAGVSQSQDALAAVASAADAVEAIGTESNAQQGFQQAHQLTPAAANTAAAGPGGNVFAGVSDAAVAYTATACMPPLSAVSKPAAGSSGKHCIISTVLHRLIALFAAPLFCCICLP